MALFWLKFLFLMSRTMLCTIFFALSERTLVLGSDRHLRCESMAGFFVQPSRMCLLAFFDDAFTKIKLLVSLQKDTLTSGGVTLEIIRNFIVGVAELICDFVSSSISSQIKAGAVMGIVHIIIHQLDEIILMDFCGITVKLRTLVPFENINCN